MAIKGDEPISAANLKNLADGGMLGGGSFSLSIRMQVTTTTTASIQRI